MSGAEDVSGDIDWGVVVAKVVITRNITSDGDVVDHCITEDSNGDPVALTEALGMLRLAEHTIIDSRMDGTPL